MQQYLKNKKTRVKETLKEQEAKITELMKGGPAGAPPPAEENPRK